MSGAKDGGAEAGPRWRRWARRAHEAALRLAREHASPAQIGFGVALGAFIGTTPLFGLHMAIGFVLARALRLNVVAVFAGEQVSMPIFAPWLVMASVQVGHWMGGGGWLALPEGGLTAEVARQWGGEWVVGSLVVGAALAAMLGPLAFAVVRQIRRDRPDGPPEPAR